MHILRIDLVLKGGSAQVWQCDSGTLTKVTMVLMLCQPGRRKRNSIKSSPSGDDCASSQNWTSFYFLHWQPLSAQGLRLNGLQAARQIF